MYTVLLSSCTMLLYALYDLLETTLNTELLTLLYSISYHSLKYTLYYFFLVLCFFLYCLTNCRLHSTLNNLLYHPLLLPQPTMYSVLLFVLNDLLQTTLNTELLTVLFLVVQRRLASPDVTSLLALQTLVTVIAAMADLTLLQPVHEQAGPHHFEHKTQKSPNQKTNYWNHWTRLEHSSEIYFF